MKIREATINRSRGNSLSGIFKGGAVGEELMGVRVKGREGEGEGEGRGRGGDKD
jgi:hypothetical protein